MRRIAFVLLIPVLLPPGPASLYAQEPDDDARWIEDCRRDHGDAATFCDVVVETIDSPAATISTRPSSRFWTVP